MSKSFLCIVIGGAIVGFGAAMLHADSYQAIAFAVGIFVGRIGLAWDLESA